MDRLRRAQGYFSDCLGRGSGHSAAEGGGQETAEGPRQLEASHKRIANTREAQEKI